MEGKRVFDLEDVHNTAYDWNEWRGNNTSRCCSKISLTSRHGQFLILVFVYLHLLYIHLCVLGIFIFVCWLY
jgi:hypothetical protein